MNTTVASELAGLPGAELIQEGLADLAAGRETPASLLVAIGRPRLNLLGIGNEFADRLPDNPETRLYHRLAALHGNEAHSQYNALIRRLVSFEQALERRMSAGKVPEGRQQAR
jgi:hypothetical protein